MCGSHFQRNLDRVCEKSDVVYIYATHHGKIRLVYHTEEQEILNIESTLLLMFTVQIRFTCSVENELHEELMRRSCNNAAAANSQAVVIHFSLHNGQVRRSDACDLAPR